jgi:trehalose 6-phosphate synthase
MLQIAAPSREDVSAYRRLRQELDMAAGALNSELGEPDWLPLRLLARPQARETVAGFMRLARVGIVTPLRDGMNLVAKEYVAAQDPADPGVLVLSRFAGAAAQLASALLVNPHDAEGMAEAICAALDMPLAERQERWQAAWRSIAGASPERWGEEFLRHLAPGDLMDLPAAGTA